MDNKKSDTTIQESTSTLYPSTNVTSNATSTTNWSNSGATSTSAGGTGTDISNTKLAGAIYSEEVESEGEETEPLHMCPSRFQKGQKTVSYTGPYTMRSKKNKTWLTRPVSKLLHHTCEMHCIKTVEQILVKFYDNSNFGTVLGIFFARVIVLTRKYKLECDEAYTFHQLAWRIFQYGATAYRSTVDTYYYTSQATYDYYLMILMAEGFDPSITRLPVRSFFLDRVHLYSLMQWAIYPSKIFRLTFKTKLPDIQDYEKIRKPCTYRPVDKEVLFSATENCDYELSKVNKFPEMVIIKPQEKEEDAFSVDNPEYQALLSDKYNFIS